MRRASRSPIFNIRVGEREIYLFCKTKSTSFEGKIPYVATKFPTYGADPLNTHIISESGPDNELK